MVFGDHVRPAVSSAAASPVVVACRGAFGTVGWFVPEGHAGCVRVAAPDPGVEDWWAAYRALFEVVAHVGAAHTSTPTLARFAVWEGYGWETSTTVYAVAEQVDEVDRLRHEEMRASARADDARRRELIRSGLRSVPRFELPNRAYYLLEGPVSAATELREPGHGDRWQRPDLFWPDDRSWHVATDVDFWSLYVAGSERFVSAIVDAVPTNAVDVALDDSLVAED